MNPKDDVIVSAMQDNLISSIKKNYHPRLVDRRLAELLKTFGSVLITGPKWCGKSWTAGKACSSAAFIDEGDNAARAINTLIELLTAPKPDWYDTYKENQISSNRPDSMIYE